MVEESLFSQSLSFPVSICFGLWVKLPVLGKYKLMLSLQRVSVVLEDWPWDWRCPNYLRGFPTLEFCFPPMHWDALEGLRAPTSCSSWHWCEEETGKSPDWFTLLCRHSRFQCSCREWAPKLCRLSIVHLYRDWGHQKEATRTKFLSTNDFPLDFT